MPSFELSPETRNTLTVLPFLVGLSVAMAGRSDIVGFLEEVRVVEHIPELAEEFGDNPLIAAALTDRDHYSLTITPQMVIIKERGDDIKHRYTPDRLLRHTLDLCVEARTILSRQADPIAAAGYRQWVLKVAHSVADAAHEGGLFGPGRKRETAN
ncbi:MAG: hypothetical protein SFU56_04210, partial [Capsulimonadales bacterium]|nr:hypothetical protein [Capsulimonadales bacterium]